MKRVLMTSEDERPGPPQDHSTSGGGHLPQHLLCGLEVIVIRDQGLRGDGHARHYKGAADSTEQPFQQRWRTLVVGQKVLEREVESLRHRDGEGPIEKGKI